MKQLLLAFILFFVLSTSASASVVLGPGSRGDGVRELQSWLKDCGFYSGTVDGIFGPRTQQAVKEFQKSAGVAVDGLVGEETMRALNERLKRDLVQRGVYVVKKGETLASIAVKLGIDMDALARVNNLVNPNRILAGQALILPGNEQTTDEHIQQTPPEPAAEPKVAGSKTIGMVALTFNDGPYASTTARILDILKAHGVPATFFVVGKNLQELPQIGERIVKEGHGIANHTWSHRPWERLGINEIRKEIREGARAIEQITGINTRLFRPPFDLPPPGMVEFLKSEGVQIVLWSNVAVRDYPAPQNPDYFVTKLVESCLNGSVIMLHDGLESTVSMLDAILSGLSEKGLRVVRLETVLSLAD
ncbi:MAG: polysaccharide deacetylase family protein [Bacillota bacterium]